MQCKTSDGAMNEQSNYSNCLLGTRNERPDNRLDKIASALTNGFLKFLARFSGKCFAFFVYVAFMGEELLVLIDLNEFR